MMNLIGQGMHFTKDDIRHNFDAGSVQRGEELMLSGKVVDFNVGEKAIDGKVYGSQNQVYSQHVTWDEKGLQVAIHGRCSCPMSSNCKHVVALLLSCMKHAQVTQYGAPVAQSLPYGMQLWLKDFAQASQAQVIAAAKPKNKQSLAFVMIPEHLGRRIDLVMCKLTLGADGEIATASMLRDTYSLASYPPSYIKPADTYPAQLFIGMLGSITYNGAVTELKGQLGAILIQHLLQEERLYWANERADLKAGALTLLKPGPLRTASLGWREVLGRADMAQLCWQFGDDAPIDEVLSTDPPWYVQGQTIGELRLSEALQAMPMETLKKLVATAPPVTNQNKAEFGRRMQSLGLDAFVPVPKQIPPTVREDILPHAVLTLGCLVIPAQGKVSAHLQDYAVLAFDYDHLRTPFDRNPILVRQAGSGMEHIVRNPQAEQSALEQLIGLGFVAPASPDSLLFRLSGALELAGQDAWLRFVSQDLPGLREQGWRIELRHEFRYELSQIDDWYAEVEQEGGIGSAWFDLELGIVVNQQQVALLPVLVQLIREAPHEFNPAALAAHADTDLLLARLPQGQRVALPWGRIKPILATLGELYFTDKISNSLRLTTLDAARLTELDANAQLRWMGGERLREIGKKLSQFGGVQSVVPPVGLQAQLREYQSEGLAWMQFLRQYQLAGILADDMGLGKTIQTLAHILLEKEAGRLDAPALVVAPTSLMHNWQAESARFTPGLRVLLLHGTERLARFAEIEQFDLVLTTYPLLARDEEQLSAHRFHIVILDESQYIKNSKAKAAQSATMLRAKHRLCLTGTPLQNHLGELWSQFHFLLPGLLGDEKKFNTDFRKPIEKSGDTARSALLIRRIKPFLLRRTKDKVAKELPIKTEIVREVELAGAQRDLYETVRLAMDKKVQAEIARKGVARSHIVILEALLKLRQVCCDPRLVRITGSKKSTAPSAKLNELMNMLEALLEEGRKILVFSQFTSMLALIESELHARAIDYALLTGDTKDRADQVDRFQGGEVPLFLISLKAGGVGLNLTAADTVIHYDPWWNPAAENQATDRAWRIGQDKPVFVYKLIAKGTLEEKIQLLQRHKADLANAILSEGFAADLRLSQEDLQAIFAPVEEGVHSLFDKNTV